MSAEAKPNAVECEHDWKEEYYGTRCQKCDTFYAFGSEPWMPYDDTLSELQHTMTIGDDLRDAGVMPLQDGTVPRCYTFGCQYSNLVYLKVGDARQTENGFLIAKVDGWYCPVCSGSYGGKPPEESSS